MKLIIFRILISLSLTLSEKLETPLELIKSAGFEGEEHQVVTEDGYKLKIHRVLPQNPSNSFPCFIMHELFGSSKSLLLNNDSLAFYLASNGFDVWLGNARGNQFNLEHEKFASNSSEFWNFSWHEIGFYDLPAMTDEMLKVTGKEKGFYVGHSQGTISLLVLLSSRPSYNDKIIQAHLSAIPALMSHLPNPLIRSQSKTFIKLFTDHGKADFTPIFNFLMPLSEEFCNVDHPLKFITCVFFYFSIYGGNVFYIEVNPKLLASQIRHMSSTVSVNQLFHFIQLAESKRFQKFDHGSENVKFYNSTRVPEYEMRRVKAEVFIYCGVGDALVAVKDCIQLKNELPNVAQLQTFRNYNHMDFIYGFNAKRDYYSKILKNFKEFD